MSKKFTIEEVKNYIEEHGNGDILISTIYISVYNKLEILCFECKNIYNIRYNNFKEGHRCFNCSHKNIWEQHRTRNINENNNLKICFPEISSEWDYKNNDKNPEQYSPYSSFHVNWICNSCGRGFNSSITNRTRFGNGCKHCNSSKGENKINKFLTDNNISFKIQFYFENGYRFTNKPLYFDFYLPDYNLCIEYQGEQHYKPIDFAGNGEEWANAEFQKNEKRDKIKRKYCKDNDVKLLEISYLELNNIEKILNNQLNLLIEGNK